MRSIATWIGITILMLSGVAHAGDDVHYCRNAAITLDGRYVILQPNCKDEFAFDLASGTLLGKLPVLGPRMPLAPPEASGRFARWLTAERTWKEQQYFWEAWAIPGTDHVLRYQTRLDWDERKNVLRKSKVSYGPLSALKAAFEKKPAPSDTALERPAVKRLTTREPAALGAVVEVGDETRVNSRKRRRIVRYDPAAWRTAIPTVADLYAHADTRYKAVFSEASTGYVLNSPAKGGLWDALGFADKRYRVLTRDQKGPVPILHQLHAALSAGKSFRLTMFIPYVATELRFEPKEAK